MFTTKRGRPKSQPSLQLVKTQSTDTIISLFRMKKITQEQLNAANFYSYVYNQNLKNVEAPKMRSLSVIQIKLNSGSPLNTEVNEESYLHWRMVQRIINKVHPKCEDVFYRIIIRNEGFKSVESIQYNDMTLLTQGLDRVSEYQIKSKLENRGVKYIIKDKELIQDSYLNQYPDKMKFA